MHGPLSKDRCFGLAARGSFCHDGDVIFCNDVDSLFKALGQQHNPQEWRLLIDSSQVSLKAVLLHNGNKHPLIPVGYAVRMKENTLKYMLYSIEYSKHSWHICADLKVIAVLVGLQAGYTKFCCFLCQWDSRDRKKHYIKKMSPKRQFLISGVKNEENEPLVASEKLLLPPLHIKFGLMKNFVKVMDCGGSGFQNLCVKFPKVSEAKIKEGIFVGPQIRQLMKDLVFESKLTKKEAAAWTSFKELAENFRGNHIAEN
ncbi:hypothetical protein AVEN_171773-1 [Araneus ventricosus]|uniref:Uncharacterized protein n=1 Tax=Araneus ventricosus TaxID=182803 RepID=A0A4Y2TNF8_ARAVE|nr:hypothetical protein AVEN_2031-1 [Araneus ventricosus]GBO02169.1 hypothetical protein AVEN_29686-1 [Araneus ventricosus]GBO02180.1 hypothetical protein AVEN_90145-1 [Araneus ventricosus]GBO02183.1 hypothetical protein AVEN_171773-1 [Araneus ventricosus]